MEAQETTGLPHHPSSTSNLFFYPTYAKRGSTFKMSGNATKYPTVDELVTGMTSCSDLGVTSGWDMLVSYSLDTLNTLLTKLWKTDTKVVSELKLSTVETNYQTGTQDTLDWVIALGAPSLKFTMDEKAELLMALSGTWQVQGTDSTGKAFDVFHIPKDFYLRATVPIALVKAGKKGQIVKKNPRRNEEVRKRKLVPSLDDAS